MLKYQDRQDAGCQLAVLLKDYAYRQDVLVLALPRGRVPVAYEIAKQLALPLDVLVVRKLGVPWHPELAMGAISMDNVLILNQSLIQELKLKQADIDNVLAQEKKELHQRAMLYRGQKPFPSLIEKTIILVDDGMATGATMKAAIAVLQTKKSNRIVVAVPVAAQSTCHEIAKHVDEVICPIQPDSFEAVGTWYESFSQISNEEVTQLLQANHSPL